MERDKIISQCLGFIGRIGIPFREAAVPDACFLPGIEISEGILIVDRNRLKFPGDLLHEAGHIAVSLPEERRTLNGEVTKNNKQKEGEEMAVLLWSYFAALEAEIDPKHVFHTEGYKGESEWLLENFSAKNFIGLPLLEWMGMVHKAGTGDVKIISWLRK